MRIGIASEWIGQKVGGPERYSLKLIESLIQADKNNQYELFVTPSARPRLSGVLGDRVSVRSSATDSRWFYVPVGLPWMTLRHPVDVLHATFSVVPWCPSKQILHTVHDVCADVHPEFFLPSVRPRVRWLLSKGMRRATMIVVPTEATKRELLEYYPMEEEKIRIVPYGVEQSFAVRASEPVDGAEEATALPSSDFVLYVGRFHGRKNLERLLKAFAILKARGSTDTRLVLVGRDFWNKQNVMEEITSLGLEKEVLCPGHVSDATLEALYRDATVFAFPSVHEGFGFPPLEAMARGLPVLACRVSAMPEVLGDAALLVDPYDPEQMAIGLEQLLNDSSLREELIRKGRERARLYTWERTARETLDLYRELTGGEV